MLHLDLKLKYQLNSCLTSIKIVTKCSKIQGLHNPCGSRLASFDQNYKNILHKEMGERGNLKCEPKDQKRNPRRG